MNEFVIIDEDSFVITLSNSTLIAELDSPSIVLSVQGFLLATLEIVIDKGVAKTPLSESSTYLIVSRIAEEDVLALEPVYATVTGGVQVSLNNGTLEEAYTLGLSLTSGLTGSSIDVLIMGVVKDSSFEVFGYNKQIFLGGLGEITDEVPVFPTSLYATSIGRALGNGEILVNASRPLQLS